MKKVKAWKVGYQFGKFVKNLVVGITNMEAFAAVACALYFARWSPVKFYLVVILSLHLAWQ